MSTSS
ncbi:Protein of unknown function [Bacillus cereus]